MRYCPLGTQQALRMTSDFEEGVDLGFQSVFVCWKFSAKRKQKPSNEPELMIAPDEHAEIVVLSSVNTRKSLLSSIIGIE
jgi:hypothetical protein